MTPTSSWRAKIVAAALLINPSVASFAKPALAETGAASSSPSEVEAKKIAPQIKALSQEGIKLAKAGGRSCDGARHDETQIGNLLDEHSIATPLDAKLPPATTKIRSDFIALLNEIETRCKAPVFPTQIGQCEDEKANYLQQNPGQQFYARKVYEQCVAIMDGAPNIVDKFGPYAGLRLRAQTPPPAPNN